MYTSLSILNQDQKKKQLPRAGKPAHHSPPFEPPHYLSLPQPSTKPTQVAAQLTSAALYPNPS